MWNNMLVGQRRGYIHITYKYFLRFTLMIATKEAQRKTERGDIS